MASFSARVRLALALGGVVLAGATAAPASAQLPSTTDPRATLSAGFDNAGVAQRGFGVAGQPGQAVGQPGESGRHPVRELRPGAPRRLRVPRRLQRLPHLQRRQPGGTTLVTAFVLPGRAGRPLGLPEPAVHVRRVTRGRSRLHRRRVTEDRDHSALPRRPHLRHLEPHAPVQIAAVQTCRGLHTHTLLTSPSTTRTTSTSTSRARRRRPSGRRRSTACTAATTGRPEPVALADRGHQGPARQPERRAVVNESAPVRATRPPAAQRPAERAADAAAPVGLAWARADTDSCHDITVFEAVGFAAGACEGNGILIDISDPANPSASTRWPTRCSPTGTARRSRTTARRSCSRTSGAAARRALPRDRRARAGARTRSTRSSTRSSFSAATTSCRSRRRPQENCVSHIRVARAGARREHHGPGLVPGRRLAGRLHRPAHPKEIGYFDRGPVSARQARPRAASGRRTGSTARSTAPRSRAVLTRSSSRRRPT